MQGTLAIIGAASGLLAATASIITIANGGPTIKVDPALQRQLEESNTVSTPSENTNITPAVQETPIEQDTTTVDRVPEVPLEQQPTITKEVVVEERPSVLNLNEDLDRSEAEITDSEEEADKEEKKHHKRHHKRHHEKEEDDD